MKEARDSKATSPTTTPLKVLNKKGRVAPPCTINEYFPSSPSSSSSLQLLPNHILIIDNRNTDRDGERAERELEEKLRIEGERLERESAIRERIERARATRDRMEKEKVESERLERESAQRDRLERERVERERVKRERVERERVERERVKRERLERERVERERLDKQRLERERRREQLEKERLDRERIDRERVDRQRAERARADREKAQREQSHATARGERVVEATLMERGPGIKVAPERGPQRAVERVGSKTEVMDTARGGKAKDTRSEHEIEQDTLKRRASDPIGMERG